MNRGKRSSRISSGLSLLLDNFQSSFAQDRQVRASTDEDKDDKEKEKGAREEREVEKITTKNMERDTNDVSLHDPL